MTAAALATAVALGLGLAADAAVFPSRRTGTLRRRFDTAAWTRGTRERLAAAEIPLSPSAWLGARAAATGIVWLALVVAGASALGAAFSATTLVRAGAALLLRLRRGRHARTLERAAPAIARILAAELACGHGASHALVAGAAHAGTVDATAARALRHAARAAALGARPAEALHGGVVAAGGARTATLRAVSSAFRVEADAGGSGETLRRLASALENRRRLHDELHAATAEIRAAATAVPLIAALMLGVVLLTDPPARAIAVSPLGAPALLGCALASIGGVVLVRRSTA